MKRGEVYWADLKPRSGSEQTGRRPVIILSSDGFNQVSTWRSVIVIPLSTSSKQAQRGPTSVALQKGEANLPQASVALCHQITTLDRAKLSAFVGALSPEALKRIEQGISAALDLP